MSQNDQPGPTESEAWARSQLSQALQDLARGEQTANALENSLSKLESKLDELLASFEVSVEEIATTKDSDAPKKSSGEGQDGDRKDGEGPGGENGVKP